MFINYDPDAKPEVTKEMLEEAEELRLQLVNVICDEQGAKVGDPDGVTFIALVPFLPRTGDRIELQDGNMCEVKRTYFRVVQSNSDSGQIMSIKLHPTVVAHRIKK
ncbi:MAG: hypothetical protein IH984_06845 [Planctomycetes bacterium]|nr:hypothetical protein [Planctomycetota bacterium]